MEQPRPRDTIVSSDRGSCLRKWKCQAGGDESPYLAIEKLRFTGRLEYRNQVHEAVMFVFGEASERLELKNLPFRASIGTTAAIAHLPKSDLSLSQL